MTQLWDSVRIAAVVLLCNATAFAKTSAPQTHFGFLETAGKVCRLSVEPGNPRQRLLILAPEACGLFPGVGRLYVRAKGNPRNCSLGESGECFVLTDLEPTLYDPLARH